MDTTQFPARFGIVGNGSDAEGGELGMVTAPVAGTAYKFYLDQKTNGKTLYFNGQPESESVNYRLALVEDAAAAVDVYLEEANGGYHLYFMNGDVKTYIRVYERTDGDAGYGKGSLEFVTTAPAEVLTYNSTYNTLVYVADADNSYYMGTYSTYTTISVSNMSFLKADTVDTTQFPARFAAYGAGGNAGNNGSGNGGSTTPDAPAGNQLTIPEALELGAAQAAGAYTTEKYTVTGVIVSIEHTTFGNMYIKDAAGNQILVYGTYDATGDVRYDAMATKPVAGDTVVLLSVVGNYNGTPQLKNAWIIEHLPSGNPAPEGPVIPEGGIKLDLMVEANRTTYTTTQQIWQQNGVKLTNNKAGSTTNVGNYTNPARLYKNSEVIIEYAGMTKIVFDCTNVDKKYAEEGLYPSLQAVSGATVTMEGKYITVVLDSAADSFTFTLSGGQGRATALYVYTN